MLKVCTGKPENHFEPNVKGTVESPRSFQVNTESLQSTFRRRPPHSPCPYFSSRAEIITSQSARSKCQSHRRFFSDEAQRIRGLQIQAFNASTSQEINAAFASFVRERVDALFVAPDPFFASRRIQLIHLATLHKLPATYSLREFAEAGGLMSYGPNIVDANRQIGVYASRILKGAKPADLPVVQASKFELVINAETARMLGLTVPPALIARADEVIE